MRAITFLARLAAVSALAARPAALMRPSARVLGRAPDVNAVLGLGAGSLTTTVAPMLGAGLANTMFFSGLPEVMEKRREGGLGDFNPLPMPIIFGNTLGWLVYSLLTRDPFVAAANAPGLLLSGWYVLTTVKLATSEVAKRIEVLSLVMAAVHTASALLCAFVLPTRAAMVALYGVVCNAILLACLCLEIQNHGPSRARHAHESNVIDALNHRIACTDYGAPLSSIGAVLRSRSAASIYFPTVAVNGINGLFWSMYAVAIKDRYLLVPNAIGVALALTQAALCFLFRPKRPQQL